jgi:hypothetical protein
MDMKHDLKVNRDGVLGVFVHKTMAIEWHDPPRGLIRHDPHRHHKWPTSHFSGQYSAAHDKATTSHGEKATISKYVAKRDLCFWLLLAKVKCIWNMFAELCLKTTSQLDHPS